MPFICGGSPKAVLFPSVEAALLRGFSATIATSLPLTPPCSDKTVFSTGALLEEQQSRGLSSFHTPSWQLCWQNFVGWIKPYQDLQSSLCLIYRDTAASWFCGTQTLESISGSNILGLEGTLGIICSQVHLAACVLHGACKWLTCGLQAPPPITSLAPCTSPPRIQLPLPLAVTCSCCGFCHHPSPPSTLCLFQSRKPTDTWISMGNLCTWLTLFSYLSTHCNPQLLRPPVTHISHNAVSFRFVPQSRSCQVCWWWLFIFTSPSSLHRCSVLRFPVPIQKCLSLIKQQMHLPHITMGRYWLWFCHQYVSVSDNRSLQLFWDAV